MIDLLYLAHNRLEFTKASVAALVANTDWSQVRRVHVYDDDSTDGTREFLEEAKWPVYRVLCCGKPGGPVAIMNHFLTQEPRDVFAKIDNDTMVPPGWLNECLTVMEQNPTVDLLGIEPMYPVEAIGSRGEGIGIRRYAEISGYIGGIGLMRGRAFEASLPRPDGRMGFTAWQDRTPSVVKAWINPAIPVFLLDRMPMEPWKSLSAEYVAEKWQREWPTYDPAGSALWSWFSK